MKKTILKVFFGFILFNTMSCATTKEESYDHLSDRIKNQLESASQPKPSSQDSKAHQDSSLSHGPLEQTESLDLPGGNPAGTQNLSVPQLPESEKKEDRKNVLSNVFPQSSVTFQNNTTTLSSGNPSEGNPASSNPSYSLLVVTPSSSLIHVGDQVFLTVSINQVDQLYSAPFYLLYNPNLLDLVKVLQGNFLSQNQQQVVFFNSNQPEQGRVVVGLSRVGQVKGISGSGVLAVFIFKAKSQGLANFSMQDAEFRNASMDIIALQVTSAEVKVE
ncbi:MAG: hypothetical protein HYR67_00610 [Bacteroidetes bacterium]|nr:hypothetical protein [Bacteroidota bacterium]